MTPASGEGAQVPPGGLAVQFKLRAGQTAGRLSITEMTLDPHRLEPPHVHADEDEYTDVAAGTIGVRVADEECEAAQGCYLVKPRGVAHASWNPTDKLARTVEMIAPAGFEAFFEERAAASATGDARQTQQRRADLAAKYRLGYFTELVPALKAKHRLKGPRKCRSRSFTAAGSERASRIGRSERLCDVVENRGPPAPIRQGGCG